MAAQFGEAKTILQPTQPEAPLETNVFAQGASVFGAQAQQQAASGQASISYGLNLMQRGGQLASAAFDKSLDVWNKYAEQRAVEDAPAGIKRDGQGNLIPPSTFYPPGLSTRAYAEPYANTQMAMYKGLAEQELIQHANVLKEKYPADPVAFAAGMAEKRQAMQVNLDPRVKPWIDVRAEQIQAQGVSQIAVANQSARNATIKAEGARQLADIADSARRTAAASDIGQGGGGSVPGLNNNVGNITPSADQYHGGKGLPYLASNGRKFETFASAEDGVAATHSLIKRKVDAAGGTLTFNELISGREGVVKGWDGGAELKIRLNYANNLAEAVGLKPDDRVPIGDAPTMVKLIKALNTFEKGKQTVSDVAIENGVKLARGEGTVPRTNVVSDALPADPATAAKLADAALNGAILAERIKNYRDTVASTTAPEVIEQEITQMRINAQLEVIGQQIRNSPHQFYGLDGNLDQGRIADAEKRIQEIARSGRFPGREKEVTDKLMGELQVATTDASRRAQQIQVDDRRIAAPQIRQMTADAAAAKLAALDGDSVRATAITRQLEEQGRSYLTNTSLSDSAAMTLANAAFQNGSISRGALQEANSNRIQGLAAVANNPLASSDQKAAAFESAREIRNNPEVYRDLTTGQRQALQGTMDDYVRINFGAQVAAYNSKILEGNTSPQEVAKVRAQQIRDNMIPPEQIAHTGQIDAAAAVAYNNKQTQSRLAGEFLQNHVSGKPNTPDQLDAHKKETNWKPPGGGPTVDWSRPDHVAAVQEHYQKFGYMPDAAKVSLDTIQHSPNDADIVGPKAMLETIRQVERQKVEKMTGKLYDPDQDMLLEQNVAAIVGKNYTYLANATLHNSALAASKVSLDALSKSGNVGQPADANKGSLEQSVRNIEGVLSKTSLNPVTQALSAPLGAVGLLRTKEDAGVVEKYLGLTRDEVEYTEGLTPEQKAVRAAAGLTGLGVTDTLKGMTGLSDRGVVTTVIDPNYAKALISRGAVHLATDGNAIRTGRPNGSAEDFVIGTALFESIRKGEASAVLSADGKTRTISWKTMADHVGPSLNMQMTPKMVQSFAATLLASEETRTGGSLRDPDPDRLSVRSYQLPNGQLRFHIAEQDRNGNWVRGADIAKDDPRIGLTALATFKSATQAVIANAADSQVYGTALLAAITGPFAPAAIAAEMTTGVPIAWPIKDNHWKAGAAIGNVVQQLQMAVNRPGMNEAILTSSTGKLLTEDQAQAKANMQIYTVQLFKELDAEFKKTPDAPDLKAVISSMLDKHLPGTEDTALRQLIKNSGYYQPGRLPQVRTGPSRIGTEKP